MSGRPYKNAVAVWVCHIKPDKSLVIEQPKEEKPPERVFFL